MISKKISRIIFSLAFALAVFVLVNSAVSGPMGLPDKYKVILDKKWVFTKCMYQGKDATDQIIKSRNGVIETTVFKSDGSVETNNPEVALSTWKYDGGFFKVFAKNTPEAGGGAATIHYTITEATGKTLQFDMKLMKMTLIYKVKE